MVKAVGVPLARRSEAEEEERVVRLAELEAELGAPTLAQQRKVSADVLIVVATEPLMPRFCFTMVGILKMQMLDCEHAHSTAANNN